MESPGQFDDRQRRRAMLEDLHVSVVQGSLHYEYVTKIEGEIGHSKDFAKMVRTSLFRSVSFTNPLPAFDKDKQILVELRSGNSGFKSTWLL